MTMLRVLIVEDEAMIAMALETYLEELGCTVAGIAGNVQQALLMASGGDFDVAFLDLNLNGQKAHAIPSVLARRGKPFAFVTGYGQQGVLNAYADAPVVAKPFDQSAIGDVIQKLRDRLQ